MRIMYSLLRKEQIAMSLQENIGNTLTPRLEIPLMFP